MKVMKMMRVRMKHSEGLEGNWLLDSGMFPAIQPDEFAWGQRTTTVTGIPGQSDITLQ